MTQVSSSSSLVITYVSSRGYIYPLKDTVWDNTLLSTHHRNKTSTSTTQLLSSQPLLLPKPYLKMGSAFVTQSMCSASVEISPPPPPSVIFHHHDCQISRNLSLYLSPSFAISLKKHRANLETYSWYFHGQYPSNPIPTWPHRPLVPREKRQAPQGHWRRHQ